MKTPLLFAAGVALGVAIGFVVWKGGGGSGAAGSGTAQEEGRRREAPARQESRPSAGSDGVLAGLLDGRSPAELTAAEAYELIRPHLEMKQFGNAMEKARANYEFQLLMARLPLPVVEELLEKARTTGAGVGRIHELAGAYAARDWDKAMAWMNAQPDVGLLRSGVIALTAGDDPERAAALYEQNDMEGRGITGDAVNSLCAAMAGQGPDVLFNFLDGLSSSVPLPLYYAAGHISREDMPAFLDEINRRVKAGKLREDTMLALMSQLATSHPDDLPEWLDKLQYGTVRSEATINLAYHLARLGKLSQAERMVEQSMDGAEGNESEIIKKRAVAMTLFNPDLGLRMLSSLPEDMSMTREELKQLAGSDSPAMVFDMARLLRSEDERTAYLVESFQNMAGKKLNAKDFDILSHRLESLRLTGDAAVQTREALDAARAASLGKQ